MYLSGLGERASLETNSRPQKIVGRYSSRVSTSTLRVSTCIYEYATSTTPGGLRPFSLTLPSAAAMDGISSQVAARPEDQKLSANDSVGGATAAQITNAVCMLYVADIMSF